jgi:hypothetical protein
MRKGDTMAEILQLSDRKRNADNESRVIRKFIDGEFVDFVNFDMLTLDEQRQLLDSNSKQTRS